VLNLEKRHNFYKIIKKLIYKKLNHKKSDLGIEECTSGPLICKQYENLVLIRMVIEIMKYK